MGAIEYRRDIDGLRALAILPVVWFHAGLPGLSGGFTGVDTFFVISGYLISSIIRREIAGGSFSFRHFYARRVRRIAPALIAVLFSTLVAALVLLLPDELMQLARSLIATVAMGSNIYFWREAGYFALGERVTPLLHTWSLGVEEQFYLLFPLVLIAAERWRVRRSAVVTIAVLSFGLCVFATRVSPSAAFYLLPSRAWELMLGGLLATGAVRIPDSFRHMASGIGLVLIAAAAILIDQADAFPGYLAALPAVGATLVIGSGPDALPNRAISAGALAAIGRISYPLYLWHWPIFAMMRQYRAENTLPPTWAVAGITLSFALAAATFRWIERPARRRTTPFARVALVSGAAAATLVGSAAGICALGGWPGRFTPRVIALADERDDLAPLAHACLNVPVEALESVCRLGPPGRTDYVIWGDSHAAAVSEGVARGLGGTGVVASFNGCVPARGWTSPALLGRDPAACASRNAQLLRWISADREIGTVVLAAYWPSYARAGGATMWNSVEALVLTLRGAGKRVIVLAGTPEPEVDLPWADAIRARFGRPAIRLRCSPPAIGLRDVTIVDVSAGFCRDAHPEQLFTDNNHPSRTAGIRIIAPLLARMR